VSRRFGRRPRDPSRSFAFKVLKASTSPIEISWEYTRLYKNAAGDGESYDVESIQFSRSILNKPMLQRMQAAIQANHTTQAASWGFDSRPQPFLIESATCVTNIRNSSNTHVTVLVYEVVPREHVPTFRVSGQTVTVDAYDDAENTSRLFQDRESITHLPFTNSYMWGQDPVTTSSTAGSAPTKEAFMSINNTAFPLAAHLPMNYGVFDCPKLCAWYKFSKARVVTLPPDGTLRLKLQRLIPKRWNPELTQGWEDYHPYDFRNLTRAHFVRVIPEKHPAYVAPVTPQPYPINIDRITVSVDSYYTFKVRAPFENRPIKLRANLAQVDMGARITEEGIIQPTFAIAELFNQGNLTVPPLP